MATLIDTAYNILYQLCEDTYDGGAYKNGYSQSYREGVIRDGVRYWDCSSIIYFVLKTAGFNISSEYEWFTTSTMGDCLIELGFTRANPTTNAWQNGDIMWRSGHTEMVYDADGFITMGAHSSSYTLERQVSVSSYSSKGSWTYLYRAPYEIDPDGWTACDTDFAAEYNPSGWHCINRAGAGFETGDEHSVINFKNFYTICRAKYFTSRFVSPATKETYYGTLSDNVITASYEAICAMWGNIYGECGYNGWQWESQIEPETETHSSTSNGYGLMQFTPASDYLGVSGNRLSIFEENNPYNAYIYEYYYPCFLDHYGDLTRYDTSSTTGDNWDGNLCLAACDPTAQVQFMLAVTGVGISDSDKQWYPTTGFNMTWHEFLQSTEDVDYLTEAFARNYLRPADWALNQSLPYRQAAAEYWYNYLKAYDEGNTEIPEPPPSYTARKKHKLLVSKPNRYRILY